MYVALGNFTTSRISFSWKCPRRLWMILAIRSFFCVYLLDAASSILLNTHSRFEDTGLVFPVPLSLKVLLVSVFLKKNVAFLLTFLEASLGFLRVHRSHLFGNRMPNGQSVKGSRS